MKRIYIAGPYDATSAYEREQNVRRAESFILPIAEAGGCPVCPHTNTGRTMHGTMTPEFWYCATRCLLEGCHAILMTPDWVESSGAVGEHEFAQANGIRVYYALAPGQIPSGLVDWLRRAA